MVLLLDGGVVRCLHLWVQEAPWDALGGGLSPHVILLEGGRMLRLWRREVGCLWLLVLVRRGYDGPLVKEVGHWEGLGVAGLSHERLRWMHWP